MTDKQIIIDGVDVPSKNNKYRLGRTKIERQQIFEDIKEMIENGFSLQNIADKYGVTRQAISLKMINGGFNVSQEVKRIKREKIKKLLEETSVNNVEKLNRKVKYYKTYNIRLRNDLTELKEKLSRKEQECVELDKELRKDFEEKNTLHLIIDRLLEASGYDTNTASAEDFEDVYENIRYEKQQLDQLKVELEAYKMESEEGKEINAELKAENEELKEARKNSRCAWKSLEGTFCPEAQQQLQVLDDEDITYQLTEEQYKEYNQLKAENEVLEKVNKSNQEKIKKLNEQLEEEFINHQYGEEALFFEMEDYKQAIEKIKDYCNKYPQNSIGFKQQILQICDEVTK